MGGIQFTCKCGVILRMRFSAFLPIAIAAAFVGFLSYWVYQRDFSATERFLIIVFVPLVLGAIFEIYGSQPVVDTAKDTSTK